MGYKKVAVLILAAPLAAFALANAACHPQQDSPDQIIENKAKFPVPSETMGMSVVTSRAMAGHEEICETMDKLMESMSAIENEKDPAALKSKLAEHRALLEQMRDQMMLQSIMQEMGRASRIPPTPRVWK
jgi:hypothetical protein